jgi:hypothetical protein
MKKNLITAIIAGAIAVTGLKAFCLGGDYPADKPVLGEKCCGWPKGVDSLVNISNRTAGFFMNAEDIFFFCGSASDFNRFLGDYSRIQGVEKHCLILHEGVDKAKAPWETNGRPYDWKLFSCPKSWLNLATLSAKGTNSTEVMQQAGHDTNWVLEVHFWTGGKIPMDQLIVPSNVTFAGDCFTNFTAITNGMTRAEVKKRLSMDGGLRSASPIRFLDPRCPGFKIAVEFEFKRDAADQNRAVESPDDRVTGVSKPYLERPFLD